MEKSNNFEAMKMEILKGIEDNMNKNDFQKAISGMMELASLGVKKVSEMIRLYKNGELAGIDMIDNYDNISPNSHIKTFDKLEDDKFYEVTKEFYTGNLMILEISEKNIKDIFQEIKIVCCPKKYTSMSKDEFLKELVKFKNEEHIGIKVVCDGREDEFPIDKSEYYSNIKGYWCSDILETIGLKMFKNLKTIGKKFYDEITGHGTIITGVEVFNYKEDC